MYRTNLSLRLIAIAVLLAAGIAAALSGEQQPASHLVKRVRETTVDEKILESGNVIATYWGLLQVSSLAHRQAPSPIFVEDQNHLMHLDSDLKNHAEQMLNPQKAFRIIGAMEPFEQRCLKRPRFMPEVRAFQSMVLSRAYEYRDSFLLSTSVSEFAQKVKHRGIVREFSSVVKSAPEDFQACLLNLWPNFRSASLAVKEMRQDRWL